MPTLGPWELGIILLIVIVIFGAGKLPEIGSSLGKSIRGFKSEVGDAAKEDAAKAEAEAKAADLKAETRPAAPAPAATQASAPAASAKDEAVR
jgi:sec-independent protein translocase protein TatA